MALVSRTACGLRKCRALGPGATVALVAPASPFDREEFEAGCRELERLGLRPVYDETIFSREAVVAGPRTTRAAAFTKAWADDRVDAVMAVRGGYGSMEILPLLDPGVFRDSPKPFIGYSDTTSLHLWLNGHLGMTSVHGPMLEGRLAAGESAYDVTTFLGCLGDTPLGELRPDGLEVVRAGEARGPLFGGTLTQLCSSLGTPYEFRPPHGAVLFIDEVAERPYRLRRLLEQLRQAGQLQHVAALVFGQLPRCDEPGGRVTARDIVNELANDLLVPVLIGFPSGHTVTPLLTLPFGVDATVIARGGAALVLNEAAAE